MANEPCPVTKSPCDTLANSILASLLEDALVPEDKRAEIASKLANGTATQQDWKLWLDLPLMKMEATK